MPKQNNTMLSYIIGDAVNPKSHTDLCLTTFLHKLLCKPFGSPEGICVTADSPMNNDQELNVCAVKVLRQEFGLSDKVDDY
jgi:hypothetical protein